MGPFLRLVLLAAALLPRPAAADESSSLLSKKIQRAVDTLTQEYRAKNPGKQKQPLAVFPLNAPGELGKRRVGYAVAELLIPHFVKSAEFLVVERAALEKILDEQRLHLTGLIDPDTALKMGHLIGAKTVLLGSVEEIGGKYLVNMRVVDADSGEVVAATHEDFSKWAFDEEAKPYLAALSENQVIGLYFLYNYRDNSNDLPAQSVADSWSDVTLSPTPFSLQMLGGGVRYSPSNKLMVDVSYAQLAKLTPTTEFTAQSRPPWAYTSKGQIAISNDDARLLRASLNWTPSFLEIFRAIIGAGISYYSIFTENGWGGNSSSSFGHVLAPHLRGGLEWRPSRPRIGVGVFVNYDYFNKKGKTRGTSGEIDIFELNKFSIEPTVALYF